MNEYLIAILVSLGLAFALFIIWMIVYNKKKFRKIADWIEEIMNSVLAFPN